MDAGQGPSGPPGGQEKSRNPRRRNDGNRKPRQGSSPTGNNGSEVTGGDSGARRSNGAPGPSMDPDAAEFRPLNNSQPRSGGQRRPPQRPREQLSGSAQRSDQPELRPPARQRRPEGQQRPQNGPQKPNGQRRRGDEERNGGPRNGAARGSRGSPAPQHDAPDSADLMTKLIRGLTQGTYECYICYSNVLPAHKTWACKQCFAVFHLNCIGEWARKSMPDPARREPGALANAAAGWRCPGCQFSHTELPEIYRCFCGKTTEPQLESNVTPHCGDHLCFGTRGEGCQHQCLAQCHPGPHPPCTRTIEVPCFCGKSGFTLRCGSGAKRISCGAVCGKLLSCGTHFCGSECHEGPCEPCPVTSVVSCWCHKESRTVPCGSKDSNLDGFTCGSICDHAYDCTFHRCTRICGHSNPHKPAEPCPFDPSIIRFCPCGKNRIETEARLSCTDEVLTCGEPCLKELPCGHLDKRRICHVGECGKCEEQITVTCQCGENTMSIVCGDAERIGAQIVLPTCDKVCRVLRSCKKHQCGRRCCPVGSKKLPDDPEGAHVCRLECGKPLKCGLHTCRETCHRGFCPPCLEASFEELSCHCGRTVLFPPIPCNTKPPRCRHNCIRRRDCGHPMQPHECHDDSVSCPPCVVLVEKSCACGRKVFKAPCHKSSAAALSCGEVCGELMICGHTCKQVCCKHDPDTERGTCTEKCSIIRMACGHPHGLSCHVPMPCDLTQPCQHPVKLSCKCGNRTQMSVCGSFSKAAPAPASQSTTSSFFKTSAPAAPTNESAAPVRAWRNFLPCDGSCEIAERNKKVAEALDIDPATTRNSAAMTGDEPAVDYPESMLTFAKANALFVKGFEKELESLLLDRSRKTMRILNHAKRSNLTFAHRLAVQFYDLDAEIEDANTQSPGLFLKKKATSHIPATFISEAANMPKKTRTVKPGGSGSGTGGMACNAMHLVGIQWGMDSRSIAILLEPLFGTSFGTPAIHWNSEDDLIVTVRTLSSSDPASVEQFLRGIRQSVADKFVGNGWAKEVRLCWVDRTMKIREEEGVRGKEAAVEATQPLQTVAAEPKALGTKNQFAILSGELKDQNQSKPVAGDSWGDGAGKKDEAEVETWEALAD